MDDERILRVLEEIRDLQQQSASNYQVALHNQQESIRLQQTGLRRVRDILALATGALILAVGMLVMLLWRRSATFALRWKTVVGSGSSLFSCSTIPIT